MEESALCGIIVCASVGGSRQGFGWSRCKEEALPSSNFKAGSWENLEGVRQPRKLEVQVLPGTAAGVESDKGRRAAG